MNFIPTGRYKANAEYKSQFCHIVGNISKQKTIVNHFELKIFVD